MKREEDFSGRFEKERGDLATGALSQLHAELWSTLKSSQEAQHILGTQERPQKAESFDLPTVEIIRVEENTEEEDEKPKTKVESRDAELNGFKLKVQLDEGTKKIQKITCDTKDGTLVIFVDGGTATFKTYDKEGKLLEAVRGFGLIGRLEIQDGKLKHISDKSFEQDAFEQYVATPLRQYCRKK
jgi:hypothetical protein